MNWWRGSHPGPEIAGVVFAPDHAAVARELARVCRPGGRVGITYWRRNPGLEKLWDRLGCSRPAGAGRPRDWGRREYVSELLGRDFALELVEAVCPWTGDSGEETWQLSMGSDGTAKSAVAALSPGDREALHRDWVAYFERHRRDGRINAPRPYLMILGRRRGQPR